MLNHMSLMGRRLAFAGAGTAVGIGLVANSERARAAPTVTGSLNSISDRSVLYVPLIKCF